MTDKQIDNVVEKLQKEQSAFDLGYRTGFSEGAKYHRDHQWVKPKEGIPEEDRFDKGYSKRVLGRFKDDYYSVCYCSMEEKIWFINGITTDEPIEWTYLNNHETL
jgi:hypothetical protein